VQLILRQPCVVSLLQRFRPDGPHLALALLIQATIILMDLKLLPTIFHMVVAHRTVSCLRVAVGLVVSVGTLQAVGKFRKNYKYVIVYMSLNILSRKNSLCPISQLLYVCANPDVSNLLLTVQCIFTELVVQFLFNDLLQMCTIQFLYNDLL